MRRPYLALVCTLALLLVGAGCSSQPKVSPTPDTTVIPSETPVHSETPSTSSMPVETDNYHAGEDGQVDLDGDGRTEDEHGIGADLKNAGDEAGKTAEAAAKAAGDAVKGAAEGAGRAVEKAGDALMGQR